MWARVVEVMFGCWLLLSPFIFGHSGDDVLQWVTDLGIGTLVITLALLSYWRPLRMIHLAILIPGLWMIAYGYIEPYPLPPAVQNNFLVGLLLLMFAIIPNEATLPPPAWRDVPET